MLILITGPTGSGKTLAALDFAQEAWSIFFVGGEGSAEPLQEKAASFLKNVDETIFFSSSDWKDAAEAISALERVTNIDPKLRAKRIVVDSLECFGNFPEDWLPRLAQVAAQFDGDILLLLGTKDFWMMTSTPSLVGIADYVIHLDSPFEECPRGVLVKQPPNQPVGDFAFGVRLRNRAPSAL